MKTLCAAIGLILMTQPIAAQDRCPTRADLDTGVRLINTGHGHARVFMMRPDGLYEGQVDSLGAQPTGIWWHRPHPILPGVRATQAGQLTIAYDAHLDAIDRLEKGQAWTSSVTYLLDGTPHAQGRVEVYASGPFAMSPQRLGRCEYDLIGFRISQHIDNASSLYDEVYYAPELGLVIGQTPLDQMGVPHGGAWFDDYAFE